MNDATAVNERFVEATNFGDVRVRGNNVPIRQDKAKFSAAMSFEMDFEFGYFHGLMGCSLSEGQQSTGRTRHTTGTASSAPSIGATR